MSRGPLLGTLPWFRLGWPALLNREYSYALTLHGRAISSECLLRSSVKTQTAGNYTRKSWIRCWFFDYLARKSKPCHDPSKAWIELSPDELPPTIDKWSRNADAASQLCFLTDNGDPAPHTVDGDNQVNCQAHQAKDRAMKSSGSHVVRRARQEVSNAQP